MKLRLKFVVYQLLGHQTLLNCIEIRRVDTTAWIF